MDFKCSLAVSVRVVSLSFKLVDGFFGVYSKDFCCYYFSPMSKGVVESAKISENFSVWKKCEKI